MLPFAGYVLQDLNRGKVESHRAGAHGMSADQVLRCAIVKVLFNFSYEELAFHNAKSKAQRKAVYIDLLKIAGKVSVYADAALAAVAFTAKALVLQAGIDH